jgi:hypothetical protein
MLVYLLTFANNKKYVGQTTRMISTRIKCHEASVRGGSLLPVHCAWRKYGTPEVEILGEFVDQASLNEAEIASIASCNSLSPLGYNLGFGGETAPSRHPDVAAKIAAKATGRKAPKHVKEAARKRMIGNRSDPEYMAKVTTGTVEYWTPERRAERAEASRQRATGVRFSDERRAKISESMRNPSAETRRRMSEAAKRRVRPPRTAETNKRLSEAVARSWQNPEVAARRVAAIKQAWRSKS